MGDPTNDSPQSLLLQETFRGISMVLSLVTAANNHGHSTLTPPCKNDLPRLNGMFASGQSSLTLIMNAIATLLVRKAEVVTITRLLNSPSSPDQLAMGYVVTIPGEKRVSDNEPVDERVDKFTTAESKVCFGTFTYAAANSHNTETNPDDHRVKMGSITGESHWKKILLLNPVDIFDSKKLFIPQKDPFENHVATIVNFVNDYSKSDNEIQRCQYFWKFSAYLSLVSYSKTYRRINDWTFEAYIFHLSDPSFADLRFTKLDLPRPKPAKSNKGLYSSLSQFCNDEGAAEELLSFLNRLRYWSREKEGHPQNLSKLLDALRAEISGGDSPPPAYNKDTCFDFHCLLLALLVGYASSLIEYYEADEPKGLAPEVMGEQGERAKVETQSPGYRFWKYGQCLWAISTSPMLDQHLHVLQYSKLMGSLSFDPTLKSVYSNNVTLRNPNPEDKVVRGNRVKGEAQDHYEEEEVEEELRLGISQSVDAVKLFEYWIRTLTNDFVALHLLTRMIKQHPKAIDATFITADHSGSHTSQSPLNWHKIIHERCNEKQAEKAIELLQGFIDKRPDGARTISAFGRNIRLQESSAQTHFETQESIPGVGQVLWKGIPHCETLAVGLFNLLDERVDGVSDVSSLISSPNPLTDISVSKLCCPVCWELLQVLKRDAESLNVRGCHTGFYPVELPSWLPDHVLKEVVVRFERHLRHQLDILLQNGYITKSWSSC